jgi:hypothetical protein
VSRDIYSPFLGRSYPDPAEAEEWAWQALGQVMHSLLNPEPAPGPPYVHTLVPPEPIGEDEDGNPVYQPPGPVCTLTEGP